MGEFKDKAEDAEVLVNNVNKVIDFASVSAFRRIGFLLLMNVLLFVVVIFYLTGLANKVSDDFEVYMVEISSLANRNSLKYSMDLLDLCIEAIDKKADLKVWYCNRALKGYENELSEVEKKKNKDITIKKAYGAMKAYLANKERNIQYKELTNKKKTKEYQLLSSILSPLGVAISLFIVFLIHSIVVYFLYKRIPKD